MDLLSRYVKRLCVIVSVMWFISLGYGLEVSSALAGATPTARGPIGRSLAVGDEPFTASASWAQPLPEDAPLAPSSARIAGQIAVQVHRYYGHAALNTVRYSTSIYTVGAAQPTTRVRWTNCQHFSWTPPGILASFSRVPIPRSAVSSEGDDEEMVVYQPATNSEWEFWKAAHRDGEWSACWGGLIADVSENSGEFQNPFGATASGLPLLASVIRVQELRAGTIDHTLGLALPWVRGGTYDWPATRSDGGSVRPFAAAEGERFRLDPHLDLGRFNLSPGEMMIARALQRYGAIITDGSGAVALQAEDPRPFETEGRPNPYARFFRGPTYDWLDEIPWKYMQAVKWSYDRDQQATLDSEGLIAGR